MTTSISPDDLSQMRHYLSDSALAAQALSADRQYLAVFSAMAEDIVASLRAGGKLMICGNGGSAGDAQHIAGEFVARLMYDRAPLGAMALTVDGSVLTATGNDYGYDHVFERQVLGLGRAGDVLLAISTSGNSPNVIRAMDAAMQVGMGVLAFTGRNDSPIGRGCKSVFRAPSTTTAIIQQCHITAAHVICALVERAMFPPSSGSAAPR